MENEEKNEMPVNPEVAPAPAPEPAPSADSCDRLSAAQQFAREQYDKLRRATASQMENVRHYTQDVRHQINEGWGATCARARDIHHAGEEYVRSNPTGSMLGALGLGVVIGLLMGASRR